MRAIIVPFVRNGNWKWNSRWLLDIVDPFIEIKTDPPFTAVLLELKVETRRPEIYTYAF